jgi:ribonuclease P protein component
MRLLRHADFERVYQRGRRHFSAHMTVFYLRREDANNARVGYTVSRVLGGAVDRNRMKRRLREAVRLSWTETMMSGPFDIVINPKKSLLHAGFDELKKEVARTWEVVQRGKKQ